MSSELTNDHRDWSAFVPDVVNLIGDTGSTRPGHKLSIGFTKEETEHGKATLRLQLQPYSSGTPAT